MPLATISGPPISFFNRIYHLLVNRKTTTLTRYIVEHDAVVEPFSKNFLNAQTLNWRWWFSIDEKRIGIVPQQFGQRHSAEEGFYYGFLGDKMEIVVHSKNRSDKNRSTSAIERVELDSRQRASAYLIVPHGIELEKDLSGRLKKAYQLIEMLQNGAHVFMTRVPLIDNILTFSKSPPNPSIYNEHSKVTIKFDHKCKSS